MRPLLEVIACTVEDALEAEAGGARRLEVISYFEVGGLTPPIELVKEISARVAIPFRVMLREKQGYSAGAAGERRRLVEKAGEIDGTGAEGIVLGFLNDENEVDVAAAAEVLAACPGLRGTFHHAFEDTPDREAAMVAIKSLPRIDRILSYAGVGRWAEKYQVAEAYARVARPAIELIAGGGIDVRALQLLRERTSITEFHVGTAARTNGKVDRQKVRELVESIEAV